MAHFSVNLIIIFLLSNLPSIILFDTMALNKLYLEEHNKYRKMHGVPSLQLDNLLIKYATAYAESLAKNSNDNYLIPSGNYYEGDQKLGENLFQCNKVILNMENLTYPLSTWYKEKEFYNFNTNTGEKGTANFTQMVWKNTKKLGCGIGQKTETSYKVVCYYLPQGNIDEKYDVNVLPVQTKNEEKEDLNDNSQAGNIYENYEDYISNSYNLKYFLGFSYILFMLFLK